MLESMMNFLKVKQGLIDQAKFEDGTLSSNDQEEWLANVVTLLKKEPVFLFIDNRIFDCAKDNIAYIESNGMVQNRYMATFVRTTLERATQLSSDNTIKDDYFQWMTLMRTKPNSMELSSQELLRQARLDYTNMKALLADNKKELIGNRDFLSTINYALVIFPEVFEEQPDLLKNGKDIIISSLEQDVDRKYKKIAKQTLKCMNDKEKSLSKEPVKIKRK